MEFCGGCGKELGRGLERGRFCAQCGHENPGNARYPLWDQSGETRVAAGGAATATAVALPRISHPGSDATRVRMPALPTEPVSPWRTTLVTSLAVIAVLLVLGFVLLFH